MADAKTARKPVSRAKKPAPVVAAVPDVPVVPVEGVIVAETQVPQEPVAVSPAAVSPAPVPMPFPQAPKDKPMNAETPFTKPFEAVAPVVEKATTEFVAKAQAAQEQMAEKVKEMMEKNMKSMTEMTEFAKGNVEAMIESAKAAAAGAETLTTHFVETSKKSVEEAQAAFKTMTAAKTPNELIAAQNEFARAQFDKAVANMSHFSETWMKLAGEVVQPLSNRVALATETVKKSIAA